MRVVCGTLASLLICTTSVGLANEKLPPAQLIAKKSESSFSSTLADFRELALEQQPLLKAFRASVNASQEKTRALEKMFLSSLIRRDIPIRQEQAKHGILAQYAQLRQAEWTVAYNVTRNYLSAIYAQQQLAIADEALSASKDNVLSLPYLRELANEIYKNNTRPDVKEWDVKWLEAMIQIGNARKQLPQQGVPRALAALREAIGTSHAITIDKSLTLPTINPDIDREKVLHWAIERRGEMLQAQVGVDVTGLEIDAQKKSSRRSVETFAAGADLHAMPIPAGDTNGGYKPAAVGLEMPLRLIGRRHERVRQAEELHTRARAVRDKARDLITLETDNLYYKWLAARNKLTHSARALQKAEKEYFRLVSDNFDIADNQGGLPKFEDLVEASTRVTVLRLGVNEARYEMLLALAALERVTAGGFCAGFETVK